MAVRRLRKSWWVDIYHNGKRHRRRSPVNSPEGAHVFEISLRRELHETDKLEKRRAKLPSFATFARDKWLDLYVKNRAKPSTQRSYRQAVMKQLIPTFGELRIDKLNEEAIEEFISKRLAQGINGKTLNNDLIVLSSCLRVAKEFGLIDRRPRIKLLRVQPHTFTPLKPTECIRLLECTENDIVRLMVLCAIHTGMRFGELIGLRWEHVHLDKREIVVCSTIVNGVEAGTKSYRARHLPVSQPLFKALSSTPQHGSYVFGLPSGRPMYRSLAVTTLREGAKKAGLPNVSFHLLRHTFASLLSDSGVDVRTIKELMGHADFDTTASYIHVTHESMRRSVALLENIDGHSVRRFN